MARRAFLATAAVALLVLSACSSSSKSGSQATPGGQAGGQATAQTGGKSSRAAVLRLNAMLDPDSMDPALMASRVPGEIATTLFDGLVRLDAKGEPVPGLAEKWSVSDDGLVYTFNLGKNRKWTDGHTVTAQDVIYSWERSLRPETAAPLASNLYYVKNGVPYNKGEIKDG